MEDSPKVAVVMTTFNHGKTLERAIHSVLNQVDFHGNPFSLVLIISDDSSTDNTVNIIDRYAAIDDRVIKVIYPLKRGMLTNYYHALIWSSTLFCDYIAFCDGDDYWTDSLKLQKQYDYMESDPDCSLCITKVKTQEEGSDKLIEMDVDTEYVNRVISFDSILMGNAYIHAQSYFMRRRDFFSLVNFWEFVYKKFKVWDLPIVLELVKKGKIHCLDFYSAVFYKKKESATNTRKRLKRLRYILGINRIKWYFIRKYGCQSTTKSYLVYRLIRDVTSVIFKRWS